MLIITQQDNTANHYYQKYFEEQDSDEDDLADFAEYQQNKIIEQVMNYNNQVQDDIQYIQSKNQPKVVQQKDKKISQQQRYARQLRLLNARKYFQILNLMYLQQIVASLEMFKKYKKEQKGQLSKWLSLLTLQLLQQFIKFKQTKTLAINVQDFLQFLKKTKIYITTNYSEEVKKSLDWSYLFWSICQQLKLVCRKVFFFDIDGMVEQVFFKLKYLSSQKQRKRQNKKRKQHQIIRINLEQKIQQHMQGQDSNKYLFLQDFQFDEASFNNKRKSKTQTLNKQMEGKQDKSRQEKRENNFLRKKNYKESCYQLYDIIEDKWILVNSQILQQQNIQDFKKIVLQGKFIIGFYSLRIIHFRQEYKQFCVFRMFEDVMIQDLTMHFYDNFKNLSSRRKRIGVKSIMRQIFSRGSFEKQRCMLQNYDQLIFDQNDKIQLQFQISNFPKTKQQMLVSQYFVIPSMLPQYCILDSKAIPLQQQFNEEKVYLKRDMIAVTSRNGWIDRGRMVRQNEIPVKKTENKSKNMTELFLYQQTIPFSLRKDNSTGHFIADDEYNNIYVPPDFVPPEGLTIINKKIGYVCSRAKINHVQLVQGFNRTIGRILPNYIGFLIYKDDEDQIERLQAERQAKMDENKSNNRQKQLIALWNKVFKKIQLSEWSKSFDNK